MSLKTPNEIHSGHSKFYRLIGICSVVLGDETRGCSEVPPYCVFTLIRCGEGSHLLQLLGECECAVGSTLLYGLQMIYCIIYRQLNVIGSLHHTVHISCEKFLLISLSLSLGT